MSLGKAEGNKFVAHSRIYEVIEWKDNAWQGTGEFTDDPQDSARLVLKEGGSMPLDRAKDLGLVVEKAKRSRSTKAQSPDEDK